MANKVLQRVWDHSQQRGAARCLVLAIADVADADGIAYPGVAYLAKMICEDEDYTFRLLRKVIATGELLHKPGGGRGKKTLYAVACGLSEAQLTQLNTALQSRVLRDGKPVPQSSVKKNPGLQNTVIDRDKPWTLSDSKQASFDAPERAEPTIRKNLIHDHDPTHDDDDGRTLAFLESEAIGAAREFAHLPYESMRRDYQNRRDENQDKPMIVLAWRRNPPTKDYYYEPLRSSSVNGSDPGRNGAGPKGGRADRASAARAPRPGDPAYYAGRTPPRTDSPPDSE